VSGGWFAVVDTAQDEALFPLVRQGEHVCLMSGKMIPELAAASPYLVELDSNPALLAEWQQNGQGRNWGILCDAELAMAELRRHLRKFLQVKLPDGQVALFRFYDPRVFRSYIVAAAPDEQARWFDGVRQFSVDGVDGAHHEFRWRRGQLWDGEAPAAGGRG
jgi:hypothetical protein